MTAERLLLWLDQFSQDVRHGLRALTRYPVACVVAIISLALGIGATTATLTIRDVVFRRPPPLYRDPSRLSRLQVGSPAHPIRPASTVPGALFARWHDAVPGATLAASTPARVREFRTDDRSDSTRVRQVTPELFPVLGVGATLGATTLTPSTVILSDHAWNTIFDHRSDVVGRTLWIDNKPFTVAGVLPRRFWFSSTDSTNTALWTLLDPDAAAAAVTLEVVVRRDQDVSAAMLAARLQGGLANYAHTLSGDDRQVRLAVSGIEGTPLGRSVSVALPWFLAAAVLLTLLIACANVAILVIAQWTAREQEIAIRASLGASRARIIRALLTESLIIAAAGGAAGMAASLALGRIIARNAGVLALFDLSIEPRVLLQAMLLSVSTGVVSGIGPALLETRRLHANPLRILEASDRVRQHWRHALVVLEIAVTVALLVVTGSMLNTYRRQLSGSLGFNPHPLVAVRVQNASGVPIAQTIDAVTRMSGVIAASAATSVPYMGFGPLEAVSNDASGARTLRAERVSVGAPFFATLDVPIRQGRPFTASDAPDSHTAVVNELLAAQLFPGRSAVGRQVWIQGTTYEIVGIVSQYLNVALQGTDWDPKIFLPMPTLRRDNKQVTFMIRAAGNPAELTRSLREQVRRAAAGNAVSNLYTLDEVISIGGQEILVGTAPLAPLIFTGLLLTAAGIYGVLAFAIARRSKELALRVAIGAGHRDLVRLVSVHSLRLIAAGSSIGIGATFALSRIVRATGGAGSFLDPEWPAFIVPLAIIGFIGLIATLVPSRRVLTIDPAVLLRTT